MECRVAYCIRFSEYVEFMSDTTFYYSKQYTDDFLQFVFKCLCATYAKNLPMPLWLLVYIAVQVNIL